MRITQLTTYRVPPRWMFLKIDTDVGIVGWGEPVIEGRARTVEAAVHELGDALVGQDPRPAGLPAAVWAGARSHQEMCSWVGGDRPADAVRHIRRLRERGFDTFQLNGTEGLALVDSARKVDAAVARIAEIGAAFGQDIEFGIDFHGRVATPGGIAIVQPDMPHAGGISKCVKIAALAKVHDVALAPNGPLWPIVLAACLHADLVSHHAVLQEQSMGIHDNQGAELVDFSRNRADFRFEAGCMRPLPGPVHVLDLDEARFIEASCQAPDQLARPRLAPRRRQPSGVVMDLQAGLIALDWGSTHLRAYRPGAAGEALTTRQGCGG